MASAIRSRTPGPPARPPSARGASRAPVAARAAAQERRRVDELDAVVAQHVGDGGDERVGVLRLEAREHRQQRQVGHDAARRSSCASPGPPSPRASTPASLQDLDAPAELPERDPVDGRAPCRAAAGLEVGRRLFLDRDDGDVVAHAARAPRAPGTGTGRCRRSGRARHASVPRRPSSTTRRARRVGAQDHAARGGADELDEVAPPPRRRASGPARSAQRLRRVQLRLQQVPVGALQLAHDLGRKPRRMRPIVFRP